MDAPSIETRQASPRRSPTFSSIDEAAEFWDTHDSADFEAEFEDVTGVTFVPAYVKNAITVRFDEETLVALAERAFAHEIGVSTLIRKWILERLQEEAAPAADTR